MSQGRKGHTLLEMVAVVAILVVVAAISIPMIKPMMASRHQDAAADVIRARWSQLRNKASLHGRPYSFEFKQDTGKFRCVPEADLDGIDEPEDHLALEGELLPGDIKITGVKLGDNAGGSKNGWTRIATFLPDGTAKHDAEITIGSITLKLHGATGMVSSAEGGKR